MLSSGYLHSKWGYLYEVLSECEVTKMSRSCQIAHVSIFGSKTDIRKVGSVYGADDRVGGESAEL